MPSPLDSLEAGLGVPDAGIQIGIEDIYQQIARDVNYREEEDHALHHLKVPVPEGVNCQQPYPGQRKTVSMTTDPVMNPPKMRPK
jgi:hypothetical protein